MFSSKSLLVFVGCFLRSFNIFLVFLLCLLFQGKCFREDAEAQLSKALMAIKKKPEGVYVQASTLGSLEALLSFLKVGYLNCLN